MRVDKDGTVVLSRRNVLALLHKLDMPGSARMIVGNGIALRVEDDSEHYKDRVPAGKMHPETEAFIQSHVPKGKPEDN